MNMKRQQSSSNALKAAGAIIGASKPSASGGAGLASALSGIESQMDENEQMTKIKGEFVEYVKEILTKTTSQATGGSGAGGPGGK